MAAPRPFRALRARVRTLRGRRRHRAEVRRGAALPARADRTPIFILGAPRSGTTLLYQLLVEAFEVGWLANAHAADATDVSRIEREQRPRAARTPSDWESTHGATAQPWGPSELEAFWYRFFPRTPHQAGHDAATPERTRALRAAVRLFADACAAPVVFKNVFHSLRVPVLAQALPEARFLLIERELDANARSLLVGRLRRGDANAWWSARPDGAEQVDDASPATQVVWQVTTMDAVARHDLAALEPDRSLIVTYDSLCADPHALLTTIEAWLRESGVPIVRRDDARIPASFDARGGGALPPELDADLQQAMTVHRASAAIGHNPR